MDSASASIDPASVRVRFEELMSDAAAFQDVAQKIVREMGDEASPILYQLWQERYGGGGVGKSSTDQLIHNVQPGGVGLDFASSHAEPPSPEAKLAHIKSGYEEIQLRPPGTTAEQADEFSKYAFFCGSCVWWRQGDSCAHPELKGADGTIRKFGCCVFWENPKLTTYSFKDLANTLASRRLARLAGSERGFDSQDIGIFTTSDSKSESKPDLHEVKDQMEQDLMGGKPTHHNRDQKPEPGNLGNEVPLQNEYSVDVGPTRYPLDREPEINRDLPRSQDVKRKDKNEEPLFTGLQEESATEGSIMDGLAVEDDSHSQSAVERHQVPTGTGRGQTASAPCLCEGRGYYNTDDGKVLCPEHGHIVPTGATTRSYGEKSDANTPVRRIVDSEKELPDIEDENAAPHFTKGSLQKQAFVAGDRVRSKTTGDEGTLIYANDHFIIRWDKGTQTQYGPEDMEQMEVTHGVEAATQAQESSPQKRKEPSMDAESRGGDKIVQGVDAFKVGDHVQYGRPDVPGSAESGTVVEGENPRYPGEVKVQFGSGDTVWARTDRLQKVSFLEKQAEIKRGDVVHHKFRSSGMYAGMGLVTDVSGNRATVDWDDGSGPMLAKEQLTDLERAQESYQNPDLIRRRGSLQKQADYQAIPKGTRVLSTRGFSLIQFGTHVPERTEGVTLEDIAAGGDGMVAFNVKGSTVRTVVPGHWLTTASLQSDDAELAGLDLFKTPEPARQETGLFAGLD